MEKFLIEVPNEGYKDSCMLAIKILAASGSHFVTHAEWGCIDGDFKAWLMVETKNKETALRILPSAYQRNARITKVIKFKRDAVVKTLINQHPG